MTTRTARVAVALTLAAAPLAAFAAEQMLFDSGGFMVRFVSSPGHSSPWRCELWHGDPYAAAPPSDFYGLGLAAPGVLVFTLARPLAAGDAPVTMRAAGN